jgi:hypothetical protein
MLQGKSTKDTLLLIATKETFIIRLRKSDGEKIPQVVGFVEMLTKFIGSLDKVHLKPSFLDDSSSDTTLDQPSVCNDPKN